MGIRQLVGAYGEQLAAEHLRQSGLEILDTRWRCRYGELDLVARDGTELVVCEVKTRRVITAGTPLEALTAAKVRRLRRLLGLWLEARGAFAGMSGVRIDVVGILLRGSQAPVIEHLRGVE